MSDDIEEWTAQIHQGDAFDVLADLPENSVHAVVTDPPYFLGDSGFMSSEWDNFSDSRAYQEWCEAWADRAKRVLKPGGHLLAFGGNTRHHRLFAGVEDAGFEIRDCLTWHFGNGFPKALDVGKAIDKQTGTSRKELAETLRSARESANLSREELAAMVGCSESSVRDWEEGRRRSGDVAKEWIMPTRERHQRLSEVLDEYPAPEEREKIGTKDRGNRDGTTWDESSAGGMFSESGGGYELTDSATSEAEQWDGWKTQIKPSTEFIVCARAPLSEGTVAENVLEHGTGALNIDGTRIEHANSDDLAESQSKNPGRDDSVTSGVYGDDRPQQEVNTDGRYPANLLLDADAAEMLDEQTGELDPGGQKHVGRDIPDDQLYGEKRTAGSTRFQDSGGASRFFYTSKATKAERTLDGRIENSHPTVKPPDLMEWLVTLVTAEGQIVLDPFAGTGTTCKAAKDLGREWIGIEQQAQWADVARVRCGLSPDDPSHVRADDAQTGLESYTEADADD